MSAIGKWLQARQRRRAEREARIDLLVLTTLSEGPLVSSAISERTGLWLTDTFNAVHRLMRDGRVTNFRAYGITVYRLRLLQEQSND